MNQPAGIPPLIEILVGCAALAVVASARAGGGVWLPSTSLGPQLTVYVSQPLWARGADSRTYGIRLEQVRADAGLARSAQYGTVHRKALLDLQLSPHAGPRLEFAARVTWDFGRESFGLTPGGSSRALDLGFRVHDLPAALSSGRWAGPTSSAALPAWFALDCGAAAIDMTASHIRHRPDRLSGVCNALALVPERPAL